MNGVSPGSREPRGVGGERVEHRVGARVDRRRGRLVDPVQPPVRRAAELAGQAAEQLAGDLAPRRDARQLEEEDRRVGRGRERGARCRRRAARAARSRDAARPTQRAARSTSSRSPRSMAATSCAAPAASESCSSARGSVRPGDRTPRTPCAIATICVARRRPLLGGDEREQRGAGHELERRVEHERVGRVLAGDREDVGDLVDEAGSEAEPVAVKWAAVRSCRAR